MMNGGVRTHKAISVRLAMMGAALSVLAACGSGGGSDDDSQPVIDEPLDPGTLSGVLNIRAGIQLDSDINDPDAPFAANDSRSFPQQLTNATGEAPLIVAGYVTSAPTAGSDDRFATSSDAFDYFRFDALDGQVLSLRFTPDGANAATPPDLDLLLYDADGQLVAVAGSAVDTVEQVLIPEDGVYIAEVNAFDGASAYTLTLSSEPPAPTRLFQFELEFVLANTLTLQTPPSTALGESLLASHASGDWRDAFGAPARGALMQGFSSDRLLPLLELDAKSDRTPVRMRAMLDTARFPTTAARDAYRDKLALMDVIKAVNAHEGRDVFAPVHMRETLQVSSDPVPNEDLQWNVYAVGWDDADAEQVFDILSPPLIAVLDDGFFTSHREFDGLLVDQRDFVPAGLIGDGFEDGFDDSAEDEVDVDQPVDPDSGNGCHGFHGTHVASTALAPRGNGGIVGVYPGAELMAIRLGRNIPPTCRLIFSPDDALRYVADLPNASGARPAQAADVVNMSFGGSGFSASENAAIQAALDEGLILVASAGNDGDRRAAGQFPSYPAAYDGVIAVASTTILDERAFYSSAYPQVDIAAPGGATGDVNGDGVTDAVVAAVAELNSTATAFEESFGLKIGTSMAAPHASAGFALMKAIAPDITGRDIQAFLANGDLTVDLGPAGKDNTFGYGLMSLSKMIDAAQSFTINGAPTAPPTIVTTPNALDFGRGLTAIVMEIRREGAGSLAITGLSGAGLDEPQPWAAFTPLDVDADGFGAYGFYLDRSSAPFGALSGDVIVSLSDGSNRTIPVTANITDPAGVLDAPVIVQLQRLQDNTFTTVASQTFPAGVPVTGQPVTFENIAPDNYRLVFGVDLDNDGALCGTGEICGRFPSAFSGQDSVFISSVDSIENASFRLNYLEAPAGSTPLGD